MAILNQSVIDQLVADTSFSLLPMMIDSFLKELGQKQALLAPAKSTGDSFEIRELAHSIKSCSGTYGASALQESAKRLEDAAAREDASDYDALFNELTALMAETLQVYSDYLQKINEQGDA